MNFSLHLENQELSSTEKSLTHLLVRIETPPVTDSPDRRPLIVGLAIDKSKSMYGEKMQSVIESASALVNWLTRHDQLTIVAYDTNIEVVQPLIPLTDKYSVTKKIEQIRVGSSTNLSGGWLQALRTVEGAQTENAYKRVILLTDGMANTGVVSPNELKKIARDHYNRGISTTTIGFGRDFSETLLKDIATSGGGNFYFIEGPEQAHEVFFREFGDIAALFGQGLEIRLRLAPGVSAKEFLSDVPHDYRDRKTGEGSTDSTEQQKKDLILRPGDLRSDDLRNLVLVLEVDGKIASSSQNPLVEAELSFYNLQEESRMENHEAKLSGAFSANPSELRDNNVRLESLLAASSKAMMEASRISGERDLGAARDVIRQAIQRLRNNVEVHPEIIERMIGRLSDMERNLEDNLIIARKQLMAGGSDSKAFRSVYKAEAGVHNRILEHSLEGQLDLYKCPELKNLVRRHLENGYRFMIFDMTDLSYVDSSGIGTMIQISNWLKNRGGLLILVNVQGNVEKLFQMSKLDEFFVFKDTVASARLFLQEIIQSTEESKG
ncbi:MAG: anti-sigma factor antagonist [Leptospiraceae bacterium]|nr:anti-sigma factor antagonist [Leptospiraceae bacterium]MCB1170788.1 anti-sigma factor antagonist [Leptospiraceae bacterium]